MIKLRHKRTGEVFELSDRGKWVGYTDDTYVMVLDTPTERRFIIRGLLEPVQPEPQWVDVTADVEVREELGAKGPIATSGNAVFHGPRRLANLVTDGRERRAIRHGAAYR